MENKEPDYSFNQSIIDALRDGKTVWYKNGMGQWSIVDKCCCFANIETIVNGQWSLTKPKVKVKKKHECWINVYENSYEYHPTKKMADDFDSLAPKPRKYCVQLTGAIEVEEVES